MNKENRDMGGFQKALDVFREYIEKVFKIDFENLLEVTVDLDPNTGKVKNLEVKESGSRKSTS